MKGLERSQLKDGHAYRCLLSGKNVLAVGHTGWIYYKGSYKTILIQDGMLTELNEEPVGNGGIHQAKRNKPDKPAPAVLKETLKQLPPF